MKRFFSILGALALTAACISGCGPQEEVTIDVPALAAALNAGIEFVDMMEEVSDDRIALFYELDTEDVAIQKVYSGSGATAEEIAVFEGVDKDAAARIRTAVDTRLDEQRVGFEDYSPGEMVKLSDPVVVQTDKYVILCVSDDNATAREIIDEYVK